MATDALLKRPNAGDGLCECDCGERTNLAERTNEQRGHVKGQPYRFLNGHHNRKSVALYIVDLDTGCWLWQRSLTLQGYPKMQSNGRLQQAHRVFYERTVGPISAGMELDHLCRTPACVNPAHLEPVTRAENARRSPKITKLTPELVAEIRATTCSYAEAGRRYGICAVHARAIRLGLAWAK